MAAADAAAIGSVAKASPAMTAASNMTSDGPVPVGVTEALNIFNAQIVGKSKLWSNVSVDATVTRANGQVTSSVQFTANVATTFMGILGRNSVTVSGTSKAATGLPVFIDFYLVLDNTPSMGVGATTTDINTMVANTPNQCAFACHDLSNPNNYYNLAKSLGVTMRIDVLRTATQKLMDTAAATEIYSDQFRVAIYTFGGTAASAGLMTIAPLTSNLSSAKTLASAIDLMTTPYQNYADDTDTDFNSILTGINTQITGANNDGTSAAQPLKYVFFVSDGVDDHAGGSCSQPTTIGSDPQTGKTYVRCQQPLDISKCTTMKSRGIKIAVLYTTYLPLPTNPWYNSWIAPFQSSISANMQSCASPGLYFEVSPSQGISDAMSALFEKAVASAHLIQ
jgi:hypothetical protein